MRSLARLGAGLVCLMALGAPVISAEEPAAAADRTLRHAVVYYSGAAGPGAEINARIAERYEMGVTGLEIGRNALEIRAQNPDFAWFVYNSGTDNYQDSEEAAVITGIAARHGWDPEIAYLHYVDDTRVTLQGSSVLIPGWGRGRARSMAEARVPVYFADLSRRAVNFSTPAARQLHKEAMLALSIDRTFDGTSLHPDGLFLDNTAFQLYNLGEIAQGGHLLEAPGHPSAESAEFQNWFWTEGLAPMLTALKDTLESSASWARDGRRKFLMINVANAWTDAYVSRDVTDILFLEFQYDPVRNPGPDAVLTAWRRDTAAAAAGIRTLYAPAMRRTAPPYAGAISYGEALLGSLAWHLTTRTAGSLLFLYGKGDPSVAGWDSLTWRRCVDVAREQLGPSRSDPYVIAEGRDPLGRAYRVWARQYDHGLVLVRNRGRWDEGLEPATAVAVSLPHPLAPVHPAGDIGPAVSAITLRNGTGAVLLGDPGPLPLHPAR